MPGQHHVEEDHVPGFARRACQPRAARRCAEATSYPSLLRRSVSVSTRPGSSSTSRTRLTHSTSVTGAASGAAGKVNVKVLPSPTVDGDGHRPAVRLGHPLHEAEAQPVAVHLALDRLPAPVERLEDVRQVGGRRCRGRGRAPRSTPARAREPRPPPPTPRSTAPPPRASARWPPGCGARDARAASSPRTGGVPSDGRAPRARPRPARRAARTRLAGRRATHPRRAVAGRVPAGLRAPGSTRGSASTISVSRRPSSSISSPYRLACAGSDTIPAERFCAAERMTASGVRSSCDTVVTNSIWRAASWLARRPFTTTSTTPASEHGEDAEAQATGCGGGPACTAASSEPAGCRSTSCQEGRTRCGLAPCATVPLSSRCSTTIAIRCPPAGGTVFVAPGEAVTLERSVRPNGPVSTVRRMSSRRAKNGVTLSARAGSSEAPGARPRAKSRCPDADRIATR